MQNFIDEERYKEFSIEYPQIGQLPKKTYTVRVSRHLDLNEGGGQQIPRIRNIEFYLTKEEKRQALSKIFDKKINAKNSSYLYILNGFLAKARNEMSQNILKLQAKNDKSSKRKLEKIQQMQTWFNVLHAISAEFIPFEALLNNPFFNNKTADPEISLRQLEDALNKYKTNVNNILDKTRYNSKDNIERQYIISLKNSLNDKIRNFQQQIQALKYHPTKQQIEYLTYMQDQSFWIKSLGRFEGEMMVEILKIGIKVAYRISGNRFRDVLRLPKPIAALSDAKTMIRAKYANLELAEYNDTFSAVPNTMRAGVTSPVLEKDSEENREWFSIRPYVENFEAEEVDALICTITGKPASSLPRLGPERIVAGIWEIAWSIPRVGLVITLGLTDLILSFTPWHNNAALTWLSNRLSKLYEHPFFTPLSYLKKLSNQRHQTQNLNAKNDHLKLLDLCLEDYGFCYKLFRFFTPFWLSNKIREFGISLYDSLRNTKREINYLDSAHKSQESDSEFYDRIKTTYLINKISLNKIKLENINQDPENERVFCHVNHIENPFEIFREIVSICSHSIIDPPFRTSSPLVSTAFFGLAFASWTTFLVAPSMLSGIKPIVDILQAPIDKLSFAFTGKSAASGVFESMLACQLEWQFGVSPISLIQDILEGDLSSFNYLFAQSEGMVLGVITLLSTGILLQYIPHIPSSIKLPGLPEAPLYLVKCLNFFTDEARELVHASFGAKQLTQMLLGVKFLLLIKSFIEGEHENEKQSNRIKLIECCLNKAFMQRLNEISQNQNIDFKLNNLILNVIQKNPELNSIPASELDKLKTNLQASLKQKIQEMPDNINPPAQDKQNKLLKIRSELLETLKIASDDEVPLIFAEKTKEGDRYFDRISHLFKQYNQELKREGLAKYQIDPKPYLDVFYNKYCDRGRNNFLHALLFFFPIPCFVFAVIWRETKRLIAMVEGKDSIIHQVNKLYNEDFVILFSIPAALAGMASIAHRAISYLIRGILDIVLGPITIALYCTYLPFRILACIANIGLEIFFPKALLFKTSTLTSWLHKLDAFTCSITPTHTPPLHPIRQLFAKSARMASNNKDIKEAHRKISAQLMEDVVFERLLKEKKRPLRKLALASEIRHQANALNLRSHVVHEDSSTALMPNFTASVEFPKRSQESSTSYMQQRLSPNKSRLGLGPANKSNRSGQDPTNKSDGLGSVDNSDLDVPRLVRGIH